MSKDYPREHNGPLWLTINAGGPPVASDDEERYWMELRHRYAGLAMQGMLRKDFRDECTAAVMRREDPGSARDRLAETNDLIAWGAVRMADALIAALRKDKTE